jgi:hypothetical protein
MVSLRVVDCVKLAERTMKYQLVLQYLGSGEMNRLILTDDPVASFAQVKVS